MGRKATGSCLHQLPEVHPARAQDCIDLIAFDFFKPAAIHPVLSFQMSDPRFDGRSTFHPFPEAPSGAASPHFIDMDFAVSFITEPAIAPVDEGLFRALDD